MRLLALETVTRAGSLALCESSGACASMTGDPRRTHGARLPAELLDFLEARQRRLADVEAFVVVTGPGSFTGLRVGLATIQGIALAQHRNVIGIPTLDAMVSGRLDRQPAPEPGLLLACLDGARGDVFYVLYDVTGARDIDAAHVLIEPSVATPDVAAARVRALAAGRQVTLIGDGADRYADVFRAAIDGLSIDSAMPNLAEGAARLAHRRQSAGAPPHALRPVYIRRPDAEVARERAAAAIDFLVDAVSDAAGLAEVAALQTRMFGRPTGVDDLTGGAANREITRVYAARHRNGDLIGYAVVWQILDELHIHHVAVDAAFQRKGVAKVLLRRVLDEGRTAGAASATLEVRASNAAARALYERLGFQTGGVRRAYYENPTEDALILWRRPL